MLPVFDGLRDITFASVALRILFAVVCGGLIGLERAYKRRPAGFRTHILICLGAAITTMTSQFLVLVMHYYTDMARLGAQVIAGIGFIGAGTIIVTRQQRVKGLTTAAGLWVSAIIGLAIGAGYFEGGIAVTLIVLLAELCLSRLEYRILDSSPEVNLYMEYKNKAALEGALYIFRTSRLKLQNIEVTRVAAEEGHNVCAILSIRLRKGYSVKELMDRIGRLEGVVSVEEL